MMKKRKRLTSLLLVVIMLSGVLTPAVAASNEPEDSEPIEAAFTDPVFLNEVREIIGKTDGEHIYRSDVENITELILVYYEAIDGLEPTLDAVLTSMDGIEYFTGLKVLYCYGHDFKELDVTHNLNLELLDCSYTYVEELDLSNCPELNFLDCNATYLQSLDMSRNPKLTTLICYGTDLKTLDISCNPLLETVDVYDGHLVTLDVSNNSKLTYLDVSWNDMCVVDSIVGLENCTALETFEFEPQNTVRDGHSWGPGEVTVEPSCTEKGEMTYICINCGMSKVEEIAATGQHILATAWETDGTSHWHVCTLCGEKQELASHVYDGSGDTVCNVCGYRRTVTSNTTTSDDDTSDGEETVPVAVDREPERTACPRDENCPIWPYIDADVTSWYHDGVHYCIEKGLMVGYRGGKFGPDDTLTRGMLVQILYNEAGRPSVSANSPFDDVPADAWYADAVAWAGEKSIVKGYGNGRFGPADPVTREQLAVMLYRSSGSPDVQELPLDFDDREEISGYALDALRWAVEEGLINGRRNESLAPKDKITRAEAAAMLQRYFSE